MGVSLTAPLISRGCRIVTTASERSRSTLDRARAAGIIVLDDMAQVVNDADVIFSVVPPSASRGVCEAYAALAHNAPHGALYVDMNSIGPELAVSLAAAIERAGGEFVDAAIHGQARNLAITATLYLAGKRAGEISRLFDGIVLTNVLSDLPGDASAMKMLLGGLSKGLCALFVELATLANRRAMAGEFLDEAEKFYPGIVAAAQRMLPTYPEHAQRRTGEMSELEKTAIASGQSPCMIAATRCLIEMLAKTDFGGNANASNWDISTLAEYLCAHEFLGRSMAPREHAPTVV
jgi:3-hydroxyisobutyrate dehydrogenase-like beta-hydroxyacid dehydrogenase